MPHKLFRSWLPLHLIAIVAVAVFPSTPQTVLGLYSTRAAVTLIGLIVSAPLVWFAARRLLKLSLSRPLYVVGIGSTMVFVYGLWASTFASAPSYTVLRLHLTWIAFTGAYFCADRLFTQETGRWASFLPPLLALGSALVLLFVSTDFPGLLWTDEGYMASEAMNFFRTGRLEVDMFYPAEIGLFSTTYMGLGAWLNVTRLSFASARVFIFVLALLSLVPTWIAARRVYSADAAWLAVILGVFGFIQLNVLRQDIGVPVMLSLAFLAYTFAENGRAWPHLLVGFCVGFSMDGHPNAYRFAVAFGVAYLLDLAIDRREWRSLAYLIGGGVLGVGLYVSIYTLLSDDFLRLVISPELRAAAVTGPWPVLTQQLGSALGLMPLLFGAAVGGIVTVVGGAVATRFSASDEPTEHRAEHARPLQRPFGLLLATVFVTQPLVLAFSYGYYRDYYLLHSVIPMTLLAAALFHSFDEKRPAVHATLIVLTIVAGFGLLTRGLLKEDSQSFDDALIVAREVRAMSTPHDIIVGVDPFYFELGQQMVEMGVSIYYANQAQIEQVEVWEQVQPTVIVLVNGYPLPVPPGVTEYMARHDFNPAHCWASERLGTVTLYRPGEHTLAPCAIIDA